MPIEVDPRFRGSGKQWRRRRQLRFVRRASVGLGVLGVIAVLAVFTMELLERDDDDLFPDTDDDIAQATGADDEEIFVQTEDTAQGDVILAAAAADVFLDLRGAPMIITLPEGPGLGQRRIILDQQIHPIRARLGAEVQVIDDLLLDANAALQLTLPSSSADLAAFQARRAGALSAPSGPAPSEGQAVVDEGEEVTVEVDDGSWGELVGDEDEAEEQVSYIDTVIENTTTDVIATQSDQRKTVFSDTILRGKEGVSLADLLGEAGLGEDEIGRLSSYLGRAASDQGLDEAALVQPAAGAVIALRRAPGRSGAALLQMSLYAPDRYLLTVAQPRPGRFETSADPWLEDDLLHRAGLEREARSRRGEMRLKDAVYTAALRNGVPSELVGELLVMLSRGLDLDRIAGDEDKLRILYSSSSRSSTSAGQILYAALEGPDLDFKCYVLRPPGNDAPFGCFDPNRGAGAATPGGGLGPGFLIPVQGTKTSGFGPRHHPILKRTVNHHGVDWGAPTGTPVKATAAGRVVRAGVGGGYGNVIYIDHAGGAQSRYAHLDGFAEGITTGKEVAAGELIGFVGTTGRSTGPHLHFEIHMNGRPVDPLALGAAQGSAAVEALVAQIIRVESAGNARAKNSRSSATGLGQFISSTWLRMMNTYRPDLVKRLNRQELLDLRFDPALSRAMVTNLARENESYLRARGHAVTPGRLYLAHFLGPKGADVALRADAARSVLDVMGASVVNANPFLKGKTVGWMTNWSDRKMARVTQGGGASTAPTAPRAPLPVPKDVKRYQEAVDAVVAAL